MQMVDFRTFRMKQVFLSICMIVTAVFMFGYTAAGCNKGPATSITPTETAVAKSAVTTQSEMKPAAKTSVSKIQETTTATMTAKETVSDDPFIRLDDTLDDMNIYFQKTWMAAEAIGSKEGYKYATRNGTFELYLYDVESDAYKAAIKNNAIALGDTLFPAFIKDGFALYFYDNATEELRTKIKVILFQSNLQEPQKTQSVKHQEDLLQFFSFISDGDFTLAVRQLAVQAAPNDAMSRQWLANFQSLKSLKVVSVEQASLEQWTDEWECYKVTLDVTTGEPPEKYGWENGQNIRWITLIPQGGGFWKISAIAMSP